jgi:replicative DNA helicase
MALGHKKRNGSRAEYFPEQGEEMGNGQWAMGESVPDGPNGAIGTLPPHSIECEQMVIGCCLVGGGETVAVASEFLGATEEQVEGSFYDGRHTVIFNVMLKLWSDRKPVDIVMVHSALQHFGDSERSGGASFLAACEERAAGLSGTVEHYAGKVRELARVRRMITACRNSLKRLYAPGEEDRSRTVDEVLGTVEGEVLAAGQSTSRNQYSHVKVAVGEILRRLEEYRRGVGMLGGLRTYFGYLDKMTTGFYPGELIVIGARPSCGKTSLLMSMVENMAVGPDTRHAERHEFKGSIPAGVFSLEMSKEDLTLRMLCGRAGVDFQKVRTGFKCDEWDAKLADAALEVSASPLYIDDTPSLDILELRARARRMVSAHGVKVIGVDYLQLMHAGHVTGRGGSREQEVSAISSGCKAMAKELGVVVILLCQLNRELEKRQQSRPMLSDLRESGAIEQDADTVGLLWRKKIDEKSEEYRVCEESEEWPTVLTIGKQRNGPTGDCHLIFGRRLMRLWDGYENRGRMPSASAAGGGEAPRPGSSAPDRGAGKRGVNFGKYLKKKVQEEFGIEEEQ